MDNNLLNSEPAMETPNPETFKLYETSEEYKLWPMSEEKFLRILYGTEDQNNQTKVFTETVDSKLAGFVSMKSKVVEGKLTGVLTFIFVAPEFRSRGIGDKLFEAGINWLREQGIDKVKFGVLAGSYFWPGVPDNLPQLESFLQKKGFEIEQDGPVDMSGEITNFTPPEGTYDTLAENNVTIEYANADFKDRILQFAQENFPRWYEYYQQKLDNEEWDKVFFAHQGDKVIAISQLWIGDCNWEMLFENNVGGGGALGVSEEWRGKGIGLAMKSWGTEILRDKGIKYVWISWTSSVGFYEKLGFKVWRRYKNARLKAIITQHTS